MKYKKQKKQDEELFFGNLIHPSSLRADRVFSDSSLLKEITASSKKFSGFHTMTLSSFGSSNSTFSFFANVPHDGFTMSSDLAFNLITKTPSSRN